ncbi:SRPBCC domain-containing protein [Aromatoleum toluvorans]|uniref:SRPBCC domain-containing protein n=1 Tax=Aromatoleum toluvorans TaxID=92002 RepID=UPI001FE5F117|nr:SRPBCC domain-containing protein [Aromatoleum toluvorans]
MRAKPEKIYRAFLDAGALARWLPPNGFTCKVDRLDAQVGGTFRMAFRNSGSKRRRHWKGLRPPPFVGAAAHG